MEKKLSEQVSILTKGVPSDNSPLLCVPELDLPPELPNAVLGSSCVRMYALSCGCSARLPNGGNAGSDCALSPAHAQAHRLALDASGQYMGKSAGAAA